MDTYADDLAAARPRSLICEARSMWVIRREAARWRGTYRPAWNRSRVAKAVLIGAVPPIMLKTSGTIPGRPADGCVRPDSCRGQSDRSQFFKDLSMPFYGYNRPGAKISQGVRDSFWLQGMMAGFPAAYDCIKAFSETDFTEDLKKFDVPTLILHGDDDQIVPYADAAAQSQRRSSKGPS